MKAVIHVHQAKIRRNEPAIIVRTYRGSTHHTEVSLVCPSCQHEVGSFVQTPEPDACGARITLSTSTEALA